jgi:hypothetical protein
MLGMPIPMLVLSRFPVVLSGDYQFTLLPPSENENKTIDELYLLHIEALEHTGLSTPNSYPTLPYPTLPYPTLLESLQSITDDHTSDPECSEASEAGKAKRKLDHERSVFFLHKKIWGLPLCKRLKRLRNKYGRTWLRISRN